MLIVDQVRTCVNSYLRISRPAVYSAGPKIRERRLQE